MVIIGIILFIIAIAFSIWLIVFVSRKMSKFKVHQYDKSDLTDIKNTQDLLPFKDIALNRIDLGDFRYVAIIKVDPYNYIIRSKAGKQSFAVRLRRAFNSIPFRIQLYTHTKQMTNTKMLSNLEKTITDTVRQHPSMKNYADEYFETMSVINVQNKDTGALRRLKEYYVVIPWEPSGEENDMDDNALQDHANRQLEERTNTVMSNLSQAGLKTHFLTTEEIISLLIDIYHRDNGNNAHLVFNDSYLSAMVDGDLETLFSNKEANLSSILDGTMDQIDIDILNNANIPDTVRSKGHTVYELVSLIRDKLQHKEKS